MDERGQRKLDRRMVAAERARALARSDFVREAMKLRQGREYFYWLLGITGLNANPFTTNALTMSFRCGEVNIGQQVRDHMIEVAPDHYLAMLKEKEDERLASNRDEPSGDDVPGTEDLE